MNASSYVHYVKNCSMRSGIYSTYMYMYICKQVNRTYCTCISFYQTIAVVSASLFTNLSCIPLPPRALWSGDEGRQMCWQLDPTEGPGRVRRRLMRVPRVTNERHLLPEAVKSPNKYTGWWVDGLSTVLIMLRCACAYASEVYGSMYNTAYACTAICSGG